MARSTATGIVQRTTGLAAPLPDSIAALMSSANSLVAQASACRVETRLDPCERAPRRVSARHGKMCVLPLLAALCVCSGACSDESPPPILQWFESSYQTIEERVPDLFLAGYGFVWLPPPFRADQGDFSVGYDVYDRFDLGRPGAQRSTERRTDSKPSPASCTGPASACTSISSSITTGFRVWHARFCRRRRISWFRDHASQGH